MKEDGQHNPAGQQEHFCRRSSSTVNGVQRPAKCRWLKCGTWMRTIIFIGSCLHLPATGQSLSDLLSGKVNTRGLNVSFYDPGQMKPSVNVRVDRLYTDYERKGFFRLGILPLGVMENVLIETDRTGQTTNRLVQLHEWIGSTAARRLELRRVTFMVPDGCTNRLECGRARIGSAGRWELLDGVRFFSGTNQIESVRATLQVSGEQAGQIDLAGTASRSFNLFSANPFQPTLPKNNP